jgi:hypothetical protein
MGCGTEVIGKWHMGNKPTWQPTTRGFGEFLSLRLCESALHRDGLGPAQVISL